MFDAVSTDISNDVFAHIPGGGNVLYMDGHVRFIKCPDEWPISEYMAILVGL